jgi:DNA-binding transcriptional ArsR family regulator
MSENFRTIIEEQAEIHHIFSNPSRLLILWELEAQEMSVGEIAEKIGATLQNTSQHLRLMKDRGILEARREGQTVYYQIAGNETGQDCKQVLEILNHKIKPFVQEA